MEFLSGAWFAALLSIILLDLVLAGDNAIVIALAARHLPAHLQKKAIMWGTVGAIGVRILMTLIVAWLLTVPGLKLIGGLGLIWIAIKLLKPHDAHDEHPEDPKAPESTNTDIGFWGALKTIIVADALMGLDNVLAVAGAARDNFSLVVMGLLISIPIVIFGSTLVLKLIERFPSIIYLGAGVLAYTAIKMIVSEGFIKSFISFIPSYGIYALEAVVVIAVVMIGKLFYKKAAPPLASPPK